MSEKIQLGLLGNGISKSRARFLHELLGEIHGLAINYRNMDLADRSEPVSIGEELARCRDEGFQGVNVTHPYKVAAYACVTTVSSFPEELTSVNTVRFEKGKMLADNTDYSGFCQAFQNCFRECHPGRVLMLGAGGVGLAIACGLKNLGVEQLAVFDANQESAMNLIDLLNVDRLVARLASDDLISEMRQAEGLINATPVGMFQYPGNPFPGDGIVAQRWAFDAVYTPENTEFLHACRKRGIDTLSGFQLFLYQGLHAFTHFTGIVPDARKTETLFLHRYPLE